MANFKTYLFTVFAIIASLAACPTAGAQPRERREFAIHYRFDKIDVDSAYLDNAATIDTIRFYLTNSAHIDSITVYAWASPEQERFACPSTRSGCAVPCGASRSQARVPSLPGPANPALSASGKPLTACCPARISRWAFKMITKSRNRYSAF